METERGEERRGKEEVRREEESKESLEALGGFVGI